MENWNELLNWHKVEKSYHHACYWELAYDIGLPVALWWMTGIPRSIPRSDGNILLTPLKNRLWYRK